MPTTVTITGIIYDEGGDPIPGAILRCEAKKPLVGQADGIKVQRGESATADGTGEVTIDLLQGVYDVFAHFPPNASAINNVRRIGTGATISGQATMTLQEFVQETEGTITATVLQEAIAAKDAAETAADAAATFDPALYLAKADNLAGVANAATSRTNLGLGTAATKDTGTASGEVPLNGSDADFSGLNIEGDVRSAGAIRTTGLTSTGDATAPHFSFTADEDTGMYRAGANEIGFSTDGVERLLISSSGANVSGTVTATGWSGGTQSEATWETGTSTTEGIVSPAKVAASAEVNSPVKAWVNFDGTGTVLIRESFNVSSITDNGTGDYTVNFDTAMPDANYTVVSPSLSSLEARGGVFIGPYVSSTSPSDANPQASLLTTSVRIASTRGSTAASVGVAVDSDGVYISVIR